MPWCVNQVKNIFFSIFCLKYGTHGLRFNGNASFSFQIHIVQHLILHLTIGKKSGLLDNTVCQGRLSVVNMGNNTKITNLTLVYSSQCYFLLLFLFFYVLSYISYLIFLPPPTLFLSFLRNRNR